MRNIRLNLFVISATTVVVALMIIMLHSFGLHQLILQNAKTGEVYGSFRIANDTFQVTFIHSVNKSPVTDIYETHNNDIYMTGTIYYAFGAGVPTELEGDQKLTYGPDGEMIISDMDLKIDDLIYVVGTVSDHVLSIDDREYSLRELCGKNSPVLFTIK